MSSYNPFGGISYDGTDLNTMDPSGGQGNSLMGDGMGSPNMMGGQSLDDIVDQNAKMMRRQSMPQSFRNRNQNDMSGMGDMGNMGSMPNMSSMSNMMEFNSGTHGGNLNDFNFDPSTSLAHDESGNLVPRMQNSARQPPPSLKKQASLHAMSGTGSPFSGVINTPYGPMMSNNGSNYQSPAGGSNLDVDMSSPYVNQPMGMQMDYNDSNMTPMHGNGAQQMNAYGNTTPFAGSMTNSPAHLGNMPGSASAHGPSQQIRDAGRRSAYGAISARRHSMDSQTGQPRVQNTSQQTPSHHGQSQSSGSRTVSHLQHQDNSFSAQPQHPVPGSYQDKPVGGKSSSKQRPNAHNFPWEAPEGGWPSTMAGKPHMQSVYKNAYSSTGFDMLGVLMRVATRPNPQINLGAVDLSCAFVVCDAEKDDFPIIYCSDNFERLTGYTRHMILGRNCRFLQSPDGNVAPGIRRKYVDDDSVLYLKNMINTRREAQISLINYRRGGQPFMNLLTMIPISWDTDQVKFFVGFQVDLVEQPNAVTNKNPGRTKLPHVHKGDQTLTDLTQMDLTPSITSEV